MRRYTTRLGAGLLALVLGLAACGGSPSASGPASDRGSGGGAGASRAAQALYAEVGALSGEQRRNQLVAPSEFRPIGQLMDVGWHNLRISCGNYACYSPHWQENSPHNMRRL